MSRIFSFWLLVAQRAPRFWKRSIQNPKSKIQNPKLPGQSLVLVGLLVGLGVLIGFVAIATDGGSALVQRRNMQNGADSAALGAGQLLAASVVLSGSTPIYAVSNQGITDRVDQVLAGNRGGTASAPIYSTTLEYGTYVSPTYAYTIAARQYGGSWHYLSPYTAGTNVPSTVDAVRVTTEINNPTAFAQLIGINSLHVEAVSAAALNNVSNYTAQGPTWPMTRCQIDTFDPQYGICNPFLFWSSNLNDPTCSTPGNFKNLAQLGEHQGASYEGAHDQLITAYDTRSAMTEVTSQNNPCGISSWMGQWSPGGNCTDPLNYPPTSYGSTCCANTDSVADIDIANYIVNEFQGRISLTSTWPADWFRPGYTPPPGDWIEVYNGGNLGQNISGYIRQVIDARGVNDGMSAYYGKHVDKVMYLYDVAEIYTNNYPGCSQNCPYEWVDPNPNDPPNRVHISQSLRFRFYQAMADTGGFDTPASVCGVSQHFNTSSSKVYGVFSGAVVEQPPCSNPPCNVGHGLNNYIGFIDP